MSASFHRANLVIYKKSLLLIAGHETTSSSTSWALFALMKYPEVQRKLREELLAVPTDTPTMGELHALPYLDIIVRETLRLFAPVTHVQRMAVEDDVIPVSQPYTDKNGVLQTKIRYVHITSAFLSVFIRRLCQNCKRRSGSRTNRRDK
jgi:hypothetical protein